MTRRRVALVTDARREDTARVTSVERIAALLDELGIYGPEPEGVVVDVDEAALAELPDGWRCERVGVDAATGVCPGP